MALEVWLGPSAVTTSGDAHTGTSVTTPTIARDRMRQRAAAHGARAAAASTALATCRRAETDCSEGYGAARPCPVLLHRVHHVEDRQVHPHDHAPDDEAEHDHHDRLHGGKQRA